ncbi:MAG: hypothetical protein ACYS3N_23690, partial [Planctomycetota bacterium]
MSSQAHSHRILWAGDCLIFIAFISDSPIFTRQARFSWIRHTPDEHAVACGAEVEAIGVVRINDDAGDLLAREPGAVDGRPCLSPVASHDNAVAGAFVVVRGV